MKLSLLAVVVAAVVAASRFQDDTVGKGHGLSECLVSISPSSTMFHLDLDHHWCWWTVKWNYRTDFLFTFFCCVSLWFSCSRMVYSSLFLSLPCVFPKFSTKYWLRQNSILRSFSMIIRGANADICSNYNTFISCTYRENTHYLRSSFYPMNLTKIWDRDIFNYLKQTVALELS